MSSVSSENHWILVVAFFLLTGFGYLFAKCFVLVYDVFNSLSLGYYKLLRILLDSYQVLDDPGSN
jgi:cytochrome b subunit of formate dehydrogenase